MRATLEHCRRHPDCLWGIWLLQGIGVLPGSLMTGQIRWAIYGGIAVAAGVSLLVTARRRGGWPMTGSTRHFPNFFWRSTPEKVYRMTGKRVIPVMPKLDVQPWKFWMPRQMR